MTHLANELTSKKPGELLLKLLSDRGLKCASSNEKVTTFLYTNGMLQTFASYFKDRWAGTLLDIQALTLEGESKMKSNLVFFGYCAVTLRNLSFKLQGPVLV